MNKQYYYFNVQTPISEEVLKLLDTELKNIPEIICSSLLEDFSTFYSRKMAEKEEAYQKIKSTDNSKKAKYLQDYVDSIKEV